MVHFLLGEGIDREERDKYKLFQDIKGFQSDVFIFEEMQSQKHQKTSPATKEKDFYITPRFGFSSLTGFIGIELQYKHFASGIGYYTLWTGESDESYLTGGIKYYFNSHRRTWYIGLGGGISLKGEARLDSYTGFIIGYRWRWGKGWDFSLGIGPLFPNWKHIKEGEDKPLIRMFELVFGYSF
jgi:hypothetical protein